MDLLLLVEAVAVAVAVAPAPLPSVLGSSPKKESILYVDNRTQWQ